MGVSAGGMHALSTILPSLPADLPAPIIIVQHEHPHADDFLARHLDATCLLKVKQADEKEAILPGVVYVAPPNYHLLVEDDKTFSLSTDQPVHHARPSIDVLFQTAADAYGSGLVGVILTGASADGSLGLKLIRERGGLAIVQDPNSSEAAVMPRAAISMAGADHVLALEDIGPFLMRLFVDQSLEGRRPDSAARGASSPSSDPQSPGWLTASRESGDRT